MRRSTRRQRSSPRCGSSSRRSSGAARASPSCPSRATERRSRTRPGSRSWWPIPRRSGRAAGPLRAQLAEWTRQRGKSPRLYPGALVWCLKKPGRDLRDKVEMGLAWKRVASEVADGHARWGVRQERPGGAPVEGQGCGGRREGRGLGRLPLRGRRGRAGDRRPQGDRPRRRALFERRDLCGRVIAALKSEALLNESVGAGLHRAQLAAGAQGVRGVAAREPAAELPQRLAHAPGRSRRDPEEQDRRVRRAAATSGWRRAGSPTAATSGCGSRSWWRRTRSRSRPACSC